MNSTNIRGISRLASECAISEFEEHRDTEHVPRARDTFV